MDHDEHENPIQRPRRRLKIIAALCTLLLVVLVGEFLASRAIATKLRRTVEEKLDAQLELGPLIYVPPYGAWTWNVRITRDGEELFSVSRVKLSLAEFPLGGDKPIIISSLMVDQPVFTIAPGRFDKVKKPTPDDTKPRKFSGMLRLKNVQVFNGQISYTDTDRPGAPPTVWGNLNLDLDTIQQSASKYTFHLVSRAAPLAEATAAGTIDVDDLLLDVQSSTMKLRAEPEPSRSPLPASVQAFIRQRRINGTLNISGSGRIPLRDPGQGNFLATIALLDATAAMPPTDAMLDHARASLVARMSPGGPVVVRVDRIDVAGGGKQLIVNAGEIELNASAGSWKVTDIDGRIEFAPPSTNVPLVAPLSRAPLASPALATTQKVPPTEPRGIDKLAIAGKADFSANASGPFDLTGKNAWTAIKHELIVHPREASFRPKRFAHRIDGVGGGEIRLADGHVIFQELEAHYGDDLLRLRSARLPVEGLPKLAQWQEISGTVILHRPMQRYAPPLDKIFDALRPHGAFLVAGSYVVDKRDASLGPDGKPKSTFDLIVSTENGSFAPTDRQIVLEKMRGEATVTNAGVDLQELDARVLDGTLLVTGRWTRGAVDESGSASTSTYEAHALLRDVDVALLEDMFRDEPASKPLEGRVYTDVTLGGTLTKGAAAKENLQALRAHGEIEIVRGSLFQMPVVKNIAEQIKGLKGAANVGDAAALFDVDQGRVRLRDAAVNSPVVGLQGGGEVHFSGDLDLRVVAAPLADWRESLRGTKIPIVSNAAGEVAGGIQKMLNAATNTLLYEFRVGGTVQKAEVIAVPTPVLTDMAAFVFHRMLAPAKRDQRPIELLRREDAPRAETR